MFGYILANPQSLDEAQQLRYRSCYCGLCHAIGRRASQPCRLSLNYDMTFLVLLLSSLYEPEEACGARRCVAHPSKKRGFWSSSATDYCADMNVMLAFENCMDDWQDDRRVAKLAQAKLFEPSARRIAGAYPRQEAAIRQCLQTLSLLQQARDYNPDAAANSFGNLMGELFIWQDEDFWAPTLRRTGQALGRFIYMIDAVCDLESDLRRGQYNPLTPRAGSQPQDFRQELTLLIGEATAEFEKLPLVQDAALLRNILYCGVWGKLLLAQRQWEKRESKGVQS